MIEMLNLSTFRSILLCQLGLFSVFDNDHLVVRRKLSENFPNIFLVLETFSKKHFSDVMPVSYGDIWRHTDVITITYYLTSCRRHTDVITWNKENILRKLSLSKFANKVSHFLPLLNAQLYGIIENWPISVQIQQFFSIYEIISQSWSEIFQSCLSNNSISTWAARTWASTLFQICNRDHVFKLPKNGTKIDQKVVSSPKPRH